MRDKCKKCKLPTSCCDCVKTQDRTIRDVLDEIESLRIKPGQFISIAHPTVQATDGYNEALDDVIQLLKSELLKQPKEDVGNGGTGGHGFHIQSCPGCEHGYMEHKHPEKQEPITHPDCTNPDCHKPDRGGACGKCHEFSTKKPEKQEIEKLGHFGATNEAWLRLLTRKLDEVIEVVNKLLKE